MKLISIYKTLRILIKVILATLMILLILNAVVYLFVPEKSHHNFSGTLDAKYGSAYSKFNILGDSVDIELEFSTVRIYNTLYYEGYVIIQDEKYLLSGKLFKPYSLLGKLNSSIKYIGNIQPNLNDHSLRITNFKNYNEAYLYYSQCGIFVRLLIRQNDINYGWYEGNIRI